MRAVIHADYRGRPVRITRERWEHILAHQEMADLQREVGIALGHPDRVIQCTTDPAVRLHYRFLENTIVGSKYLCVVVKSDLDDFVLTAYLTDRFKPGVILWTSADRG